MQYTTIEEICKSPWGLVAHRRAEIESGPFGTFEKIFVEELSSQFPTAAQAARMMDCCVGTARRWLYDSDARYIMYNGISRFYRDDVCQVAAARNEALRERNARKAAKFKSGAQ